MSSWLSSPGKTLMITGIVSGFASVPALAQNDESDIEEVVVTGSYIRGTPTDAPSPVEVIDRLDIEAQGAAQIWDVVKNLEINSGSTSNIGSANEGSELEGTANINLRNLGQNSTLTLINGKRQVAAATVTRGGAEFVDINTIPLVMVERLEVLTDGGSALYGSDAVAGVVNIIMRTDFEGLEIYGDMQQIEGAGSLFDKTASVIWGWGSDDGASNLVLSGEMFERDPVPIEEASFYGANSEFTGTVGSMGTPIVAGAYGSQVNPAYINQEIIDLNVAEGGTSSNVYTDPLCEELGYFTGSRTEQRGERSASCREETSQWTNLTTGMDRQSLSAAFSHDFNGQTEFYSFFQWSKSEIQRSDSGNVSTRGPTIYLPTIGSHSGGPYGPLGAASELGSAAAFAGLDQPTITNAPISMANGGINVPMSASLNSQNMPRMGGDEQITDTETIGAQVGLNGEFDFADRFFSFDVSYSWSGTSFEENYRTFQRDRAELAANGLGGPNCTPNGREDYNFEAQGGPFWANSGFATQYYFPGFVHTTRESISLALTSNNHGQNGCEFYNPFLTAVTDPDLANSDELMDWLVPVVKRSDNRNKLGVFDAVISGEMFELPGGMAQFAAGFQFRGQNNKSNAPAINEPGIPDAILGYDDSGVPNEFHYVSNNYECSYCVTNYDSDRNVRAWFTELSLPVIDNVESQLALRYEDYGGFIGGEVTPKAAISWRPQESWLLRASYSKSFRAPNVGIVYNGLDSASATFQDPISNQAVRAGLLPPTLEHAESESTYTIGKPAPYVGNEHADTFSAGFIWTPEGVLDGLKIGADFWRFELEDKVLPEPAISAVQPEIEAFKIAAADPNNYVINDSLEADADNPYQACNPNEIEAQFGRDSEERLGCVVDPRTYQVEGVHRALGSTASLITTTLGAINAGEIISDGVDVNADYNWDTDFGSFRLALTYTHVRQYTLNGVPGLESGLQSTGVTDAAGTTGDGSLVRSLPDNKGNITLNWSRGNHSVTAITRLIGSYRDLLYESTYEQGNDLVRSLARKEIDSYQSWDFQYNFVKEWANESFGTSVFTIGVLDAFEADLPYREAGGGLNYDSVVFDGRGRRIYARALLQF